MATPTDPTAGSFEPTPPGTLGFGARESADETRQAQQAFANDMPVDVNVNAVVCRSQTLTFDMLGKSVESNFDRRSKMFDASADRRNSLFDHFAAVLTSKTLG